MNKTFIIIHILTLFICVKDIFTNLFVFVCVIENVVINKRVMLFKAARMGYAL